MWGAVLEETGGLWGRGVAGSMDRKLAGEGEWGLEVDG